MARYLRTRKYSRYNRRKTWSSRISNIRGAQSVTANNNLIVYYDLCKNPEQSESSVSNKFTVKNVHLQLELAHSATANSDPSQIENLQAYIVYIPQGYAGEAPSEYANIPFAHPEWIMTYRYIGSCQPDTPYYPSLKMFSRLSRKLDTGDRITLIILGNNTSSQYSNTVSYQGLVKYNTKAN